MHLDPRQCILCPVVLEDEAALQDHNSAFHGPNFECVICGRRVETLQAMTLHVLRHKETPVLNSAKEAIGSCIKRIPRSV